MVCLLALLGTQGWAVPCAVICAQHAAGVAAWALSLEEWLLQSCLFCDIFVHTSMCTTWKLKVLTSIKPLRSETVTYFYSSDSELLFKRHRLAKLTDLTSNLEWPKP